jgi:chromatin remodeling complex protein RSC6
MSSTTSGNSSNKMAGKKQTKTETPAAPAPVATPVPAKKATKKVETPAKAEVTVPTVAAPVATPAVAQTSEVLLATLTEQLRALSADFTTKVREAVRGAQEAAKQAKREQRNSKRKVRKNPEDMTAEERKAWEARRANNAFLKPRALSPELCAFMGIAAGSLRAQTEVTKFVSNYIKTHNCFDPNFKRRIIPNAALGKLLRVGDKDEVTYLNLQSYLKVHFVKA